MKGENSAEQVKIDVDEQVADKKSNKNEEEFVKPVSLAGLFRYADTMDYLLMIWGTLMGLATGVSMPLFAILLGNMYTDFQSPGADVLEAGVKYAKLFGYLAVGITFTSFFQVAFFTISSERQTLRIRKKYLDAVLTQEISWFDTCQSGELTSKVAENTVIIRESMGEKLGALFQFLSMFLTGFVVGFIKNWQLTLVICAASPLLAFGGFMMMKMMNDATAGGLQAYAAAGAIAEESFSMIRTIVGLGVEGRVARRYRDSLRVAEDYGVKKARGQGIGMGFTFGVYFLCYALAFWYGSVIVLDGKRDAAAAFPPNATATNENCALDKVIDPALAVTLQCFTNNYDSDFIFQENADICNCLVCNCGCTVSGDCPEGGDIVLVFFAVVIGAFSLGQASPSIAALTNGRVAAAKIYEIIGRTPLIDSSSKEGKKLDNLVGNIQFNSVRFHYPSRPDVDVFTSLNLQVKAGETVALVGGSGCGKSTVTQLVQRFYDPVDGSITLDGVDLKEINVSWLRSNIGLVGQEPVLFAATIGTNISYGKESGNASQQEIEEAAKSANAYNFISEFPEKFDTFVGERGSKLSGGQKQRIAIARAIIRDPSILILDEATSALDNESERIVQQALDDLLQQKKRTTLVIAHRLSTVRNADKIVVLGQGGFLEQGTHEELMALEHGHYAALVAAAQRSQEDGAEVDLKNLIDEDEVLAQRMGSSSFHQERQKSSERVSSSSAIRKESSSVGGKDDSLLVDNKKDGQQQQQEEEDHEETVVSTNSGCCGKKKKGPKEEKEKLYAVSMKRLFGYSANEKWWYVPGIFAAIVNGSVMPLFAILFAGISNVYFFPTAELITDEANKYSLYFVGLGAAVGICYYLQFVSFGIIAEKMTTRVRYELLLALLRMEIGFFDVKENSVGALTSNLATDAALVKAAIADRLAIGIMNLVTIVVGLIIAFVYGWKLTLVLFALIPLIMIGGAVQFLMMAGFANEDDKAMAESSQVLSESIAGVRTVTAFNLRERVVDLYDFYLIGPSKLSVRKGCLGGIGFGFSQGVLFAVYSIAFYYGSILIVNEPENYDFQTMINVFFAVVMLGFGVGQSTAMAPDLAKGGNACSNVFKIIDRPSKIDSSDPKGKKDEAVTNQDIVISGANFHYPTRPDVEVFKNFNLTIKSGTTVAFCGQSGSGKSTVIATLERFYDLNSGSINFHGIEIKDANVKWLRSEIGLVSQEPQLFNTTIFENIAYGLGYDESIPVTQEQIEEAAKAANAHGFISEFPDGYQTQVGGQGGQLSGGQKQRICIARCLLRNPKLLLLDEATSALDNESERIVQQTLDGLMASNERTTIVVAHRLSTIQNADVICVIDHGMIVEQGKHDELLAKPDGIYAKLYQSQQKHK